MTGGKGSNLQSAARPEPDKDVLYVLYDGECSLCTASVNGLKRLDSAAELRFIPLQSMEGNDAPRIPGLAGVGMEALYEKLHVADPAGRLFAGAEGVVRIMKTVPGLRWVGILYAIPGMGRLGDAVYRWIAKRRYDWFGRTETGCAGSSCKLPAGKRESADMNQPDAHGQKPD